MLQQIMDWSKSTHIKFQMYFTKDVKVMKNVMKQKHDLVICTEKFLAVRSKKAGAKPILIEKEWYKNVGKLYE